MEVQVLSELGDGTRGGVVVLTRVETVHAEMIVRSSATFMLVKLDFKNANVTQVITMMATYLNPDPNAKEKDAIEVWK
jgi:hypothetical protein